MFEKLLDWGVGALTGALDRGATSALDRGVNMGFDGVLGRIFGGATSAPGGATLGREQAAYDEARFPGTNPWERLGSSAAFSPVQVQKQQDRLQRDLTDKTLSNQREIAEIQGRAAAVSAASEYPYSESAAGELGDYVVSGVRPGDLGTSAKTRGSTASAQSASAAIQQAETADYNAVTQRLAYKLSEIRFNDVERILAEAQIGKVASDPLAGYMAALGNRIFREQVSPEAAGKQLDELERTLQELGVPAVIAGMAVKALNVMGRSHLKLPNVRNRVNRPKVAPTSAPGSGKKMHPSGKPGMQEAIDELRAKGSKW